MALPREYATQICPIARSLEVIGERWTLLILRDAFYGVRRFSDFHAHLQIPKAVLSDRLQLLVDEGVLLKVAGAHARTEYELTAKGEAVWPTIWALISWGNDFYGESSCGRTYTHAGCGGRVGSDGSCGSCRARPAAAELIVHPLPAPRAGDPAVAAAVRIADDPVSRALQAPRRLLEPIA